MKPPFPLSPILAGRRLAAAILAGAAIFAAPLSAQMTPGMLGTRTVEASFFIEDVRSAGIDNGTGLTLRGSLPIGQVFVLGLGGSIEKINTNNYREKQLFASLTAFTETAGVRPFATATLANDWQSSVVGGTKFRSDEAFWALGAGIEAPVTDRTAFVGRIDYNRYFRQRFGNYWLYTVGFNHWLSEKVAMLGSVTFRDSYSVYYGVGIGMKY